MNIKRLQLTNEMEYAEDYKCQNYDCQRNNEEKTLIGWSKDSNNDFVAIYECNNCESQFYFHPVIERKNWNKFIESLEMKKEVKEDITSYTIDRKKVMEKFHKFRNILCSNKYFYSEKMNAYENFLKNYWLYCDKKTFESLSLFMGPGGEIAMRFKYEKITDYDLINLIEEKIIYKKTDVLKLES